MVSLVRVYRRMQVYYNLQSSSSGKINRSKGKVSDHSDSVLITQNSKVPSAIPEEWGLLRSGKRCRIDKPSKPESSLSVLPLPINIPTPVSPKCKSFLNLANMSQGFTHLKTFLIGRSSQSSHSSQRSSAVPALCLSQVKGPSNNDSQASTR